jgi:hypothetical protein
MVRLRMSRLNHVKRRRPVCRDPLLLWLLLLLLVLRRQFDRRLACLHEYKSREYSKKK